MSQLNSLYLHQPPLANDCRPAFKTNWPTRSFIAILLLGAMVTVGESSAQTQFWITDANAVTTVNSAIITWKSVVPADSQVEYGRTALYGSVSTLAPTRVSAHAMTLSGLIAGTTYHYRLRSRDLGGVAVIGNDHTFTTVTATKVTPITVSVSPQSATVVASATQQFSATVANTTNKAVSWSATTGTVNSSGLFTASAVTVSTAATVTATSAADPTKSAKASVTLQPRAAIVVTISPASATLPSAAVQQFTASVSTHPNRRSPGLPLPDRLPQPAYIPLLRSPRPPRPRLPPPARRTLRRKLSPHCNSRPAPPTIRSRFPGSQVQPPT
jgi:hypothetical protein